MEKVKITKSYIIAIVILIVVAVVGFLAGMYFQISYASRPDPATTYTSETIAKEIKDVCEYAVLDYRYTNVGKFENQREFYGWSVPFTSKSFILTYDGEIKLGVEGDKIDVNVTGNIISIKLPDVKILSHEVHENSIKVMDETHNIFNQVEVEDYAKFATDRKLEKENEINASDLLEQAKEKVKVQMTDLLDSLPDIKENYQIQFE